MMTHSLSQVALQIWLAAVDAVRADRLIEQTVRIQNDCLLIQDHVIPLSAFDRLVVVGAGKASASMAMGLSAVFSRDFLDRKKVEGWVNVPADCAAQLDFPITLHPARPAGVNEPTAAGVFGSQQILKLVSSCGPRDLCICLLSGGGSALLPAVVPGITLDDKIQLIRALSARGANIEQLNIVRKQISLTKGNGLARIFQGQAMFSLIISDVIGDPLELIASGPTAPSRTSARDALDVLQLLDPEQSEIAPSIYRELERQVREMPDLTQRTARSTSPVVNLIIGNLQVAVDAAKLEAKRRGWIVHSSVATQLEGTAEFVGESLAGCLKAAMQTRLSKQCWISGGEPVVRLVDAQTRGKGGRNQQLVLAALVNLQQEPDHHATVQDFCLLSGGTDGEDGPTDAAGAFVDQTMLQQIQTLQLDPLDYLHRNDAYAFFAQVDGLIKTGPTGTNVCDIRIAMLQ
jgi:hydroxypyruvate reductase